MRRSGASISAWIATATVAACAGPHVAPNLPVKGDRRYIAFATVEARARALEARDLARAAGTYAPEAEVVDLETGEAFLRGREAIQAELSRLLARCAALRIEVVDRAYSERGRFVSDLERVHCAGSARAGEWIRYEIADSRIVREWRRRSPAER